MLRIAIANPQNGGWCAEGTAIASHLLLEGHTKAEMMGLVQLREAAATLRSVTLLRTHLEGVSMRDYWTPTPLEAAMLIVGTTLMAGGFVMIV